MSFMLHFELLPLKYRNYVKLFSLINFPVNFQVSVFSFPLWESVIVLCFVVRYFMSILVLQSS